jgi:MFS transporter, DHA1 family, multidrug resistance protein
MMVFILLSRSGLTQLLIILAMRKEATYIVEFEGPDSLNPPLAKRISATILLSLTTFVVTFASSVFSCGLRVVAAEFDISQEVATLGSSLFVLGFAVAPLLRCSPSTFQILLINVDLRPVVGIVWSEMATLLSYACFGIFQIPVAVAQNVEIIMLCRFFGGVFASPLAIVGGCMADMWSPAYRSAAIARFAFAAFFGPAMGPVIDGFVTQSYLDWRWTQYLTAILAFFFRLVDIIFFWLRRIDRCY